VQFKFNNYYIIHLHSRQVTLMSVLMLGVVLAVDWRLTSTSPSSSRRTSYSCLSYESIMFNTLQSQSHNIYDIGLANPNPTYCNSHLGPCQCFW